MNKILSKTKFTLKTTVLSLFFLISLLLLFIIGIQLFYIDKQLSIDSINTKIKSISLNIQTVISSSEKTNFNTVELMDALDSNDKFKLYINILSTQKNLYAVYTGYKDGSFYEIINLDIDKSLRKTYNASLNDKWLFITIDGKNIDKREVSLFDKNLNLTTSRVEMNNYNPTLRPWYIEAISKDGIIKTSPYKFSHIDTFGLTYAKNINENGDVVAIDVLVDNFNNIYKEQVDENSMEIFLFQKNGNLLSTLSNSEDNFQEFLNNFQDFTKFKNAQIIELNNTKYIASIEHIITKGENEYLLLLADYKETIKPYNKQTLKLLSTFLLTSFIMIPIVLYFSRIIVKPIFRLVNESKKIKNRDYSSVQKVSSNIEEVSILSSSFMDMSKSIYEYQHSLEEKVKQRTKELSEKNAELYKVSITDKLTNIYNREKLDSVLNDEINKSLRYNTDFSVLILDIDFFKKINDGFGHQVGDEVLKESAKIFLENIRNTDVLGRWGGEEFLVICPHTKQIDAKVIALKLNRVLQEHKFKNYPNSVTISVGVASYYKGIEKFDEIISNADKALYEAKNQGRNRVILFENI